MKNASDTTNDPGSASELSAKGYRETGIQDTAGEPESKGELRAAKEYAEMIVDTVREGLLVLNLDLHVVSANQSFYEQFEMDPEETTGRHVYELGNGQWDIPKLRKLLEEILPHDKAFDDYEVEQDFEGIGRHVMLLNARQLGEHDLILLAIEDVTARRETEQELRESEAKFRTLYERSPDAIVVLAPDGTVLDANPAAARTHDVPREQIVGRDMLRFVPEPLREDFPDELEALLTGDQPYIETRVLTASAGEEVPVEIRARRTSYEGHDDAVLLHVRDMTERKKAEEKVRALNDTLEERVEERTQEVREQEERFRRLVDASAQIVWTTDAEGRVVQDSPSWRAFTGQSVEEWKGQGWTNALHPEDRDETLETWQSCVESETPVNTEYRVYHAESDTWRWTRVRAVPLRDEAGDVRGWIGMNIDIDERRRAEQRVRELVHALTEAEEKERRRIATVLHDDLQQQLYGAEMTARRARRMVEGGGETMNKEATAQLGELCDQMDEILGSAVETTRTLSSELSPSVLGDEDLENTFRWLAGHMEERHDLTVELDVAEAPVLDDREQRALLTRLMRELLFNVVKHAQTDRAHLDARAEEGWLLVQVCDEGKGFDPDELASTGGDGYGLSHVRERLHFLGGRFEVEATPGEGACFTIALPDDFGKDE